VVSLFQKFAQNKTVRVKFGVFNMGNATEIRATRRPQYAIIKSDGTFRHATAEELKGEHPALLAAAAAGETSCVTELAK
ncbi:hypothetical protein K2X33_01700, partial [bacterium]|nr:hypothetical protein [bacterium]